MESIDPNDMLLVQARRCRRCGRVLTGKNAIQDGIGRACKLLEELPTRAWVE